MLEREARISDDPDFPNWMSFGEGLTYCETARRMAKWHHLFKKTSKLPSEVDVYVRDVGGKTQFLHTVKLRLQVDVIPARNDGGEDYAGILCVVCHNAMPGCKVRRGVTLIEWDYAACKECGKEFAYDFVEDDRNFDAANGR